MRIGLTGGIASGKSTVADLFAKRGIPVLDTDLIAREVVRPGSDGLQQVVAEFGSTVLADDGTLDRRGMRERIFSSDDARARLEAILHPRIRARLVEMSADAGGPYQVHVIPLLVESGLQRAVDRVLVVDCSAAVQAARLLARDAEDEETARKMIAAQSERQRRLDAADDVIVNDGAKADLKALVDRLDRFYRELAASGEFRRKGLRLP
jgi:dephospho-CoA kinase